MSKASERHEARRQADHEDATPRMTVEEILVAIRSLKSADRARLVAQIAPEICGAAMDHPQAITMMLAQCRRECHEPEARRRMEFVMDIVSRMKGAA